jgi:hypothetical protein
VGLASFLDLSRDLVDLRKRVVALVDPQAPDQILHLAGGDALHAGFGNDREERLFAAPARFEEAGEVAALTNWNCNQYSPAGRLHR